MSSDSKYPGLTSGPFNWINNKRVESSLPETFEDVEPRTGKVLAKVPVSGQAELDQAVLAAKAAFPAWSQVCVYCVLFCEFYICMSGFYIVCILRFISPGRNR